MKAIETSYDGYRFRSRLEARWAVYFNALDIKYEYEREGFDLDGTWYLPDFWLADLDCWVEIKGQNPTTEEQQKLAALIAANAKHVGIIRVGTPDPVANEGYAFWMGKFIGFQVFVECLACGTIGIVAQVPEVAVAMRRLRCACWEKGGFSTDTPRLIAAYDTARAARFEYGETPQLPEDPEYTYEELVMATAANRPNILTRAVFPSIEAICDADRHYFELHPDQVKFTRPFNPQEVPPEVLVRWKEQFGRYPFCVEVHKTATPDIRSRTFLNADGMSNGIVWDGDTPEAVRLLSKSAQELKTHGQQVLHKHKVKQARKQVNRQRNRNRKRKK